MGSWVALALVPAAAVVLAVVAVRRCFVVVTVSGASMAPALEPGERVLVRRGTGDWLRAGVVVVLRQPEDGCRVQAVLPDAAGHRGGDGWVIKRVAAADGDAVPDSVRLAVGGAAVVPPGKLVVLGDNAYSGDSRMWGFYSASHVLGTVVARLSPGGGRRSPGPPVGDRRA
jgi:signal peptidase I